MSRLLQNTKNLALLTETLEPKEKIYVQSRVQGSLPVVAARVAGYANPESKASQLEQSTRVRSAIEYSIRVESNKIAITRDDCLAGLMDAVNMSATAAELTSAWKEIAKMQGYYAPTEQNVNVTKREMVAKLDDSKLMEMAAIDGDYELVDFDDPVAATA